MTSVAPSFRAVRSFASRLLSVAVATRDWFLHSGRHRRALRRLRQSAQTRRIIVVCYGNICRSPYLEAALRRLMPGIDVSSAGLIGPGRPVPENSTTVAARRGLDLSAHRSRVVTREMLRTADLVIVMEGQQGRFLADALGVSPNRIVIAGDLDPQAGARAIRDPWQQPLAIFESSFARLDRCANTVAEVLQEQSRGRSSEAESDRGSAAI